MYFYYWTAIGLALLVGWAFDAGHRRVYFHAGWIGGLVGLPAVIFGMIQRQTTLTEVLERLDLFLKCRRFDDLFISKSETALLVLAGIYVWTRRRSLAPLWLAVAAGWLLRNEQVATRFLVINFHYRNAVYGPLLTCLLLLIAVIEATALRPKWAARALFALAFLNLGVGFWFRTMDASLAKCSLDQMAIYHGYLDQRRGSHAIRLAPGAAVGGDVPVMEWSLVLDGLRPVAGYPIKTSPSVPNAEWNLREAFNAYLLGRDCASFEKEQRNAVQWTWFGPWFRDPEVQSDLLVERLADYDKVLENPAVFIKRFDLRYVFLPVGSQPPAAPGLNGDSWSPARSEASGNESMPTVRIGRRNRHCGAILDDSNHPRDRRRGFHRRLLRSTDDRRTSRTSRQSRQTHLRRKSRLAQRSPRLRRTRFRSRRYRRRGLGRRTSRHISTLGDRQLRGGVACRSVDRRTARVPPCERRRNV